MHSTAKERPALQVCLGKNEMGIEDFIWLIPLKFEIFGEFLKKKKPGKTENLETCPQT